MSAWIVNDSILWIKPAPNYYGWTGIEINADDGRGGITRDSVNIDVAPINDPPEIINLPDSVSIVASDLGITLAYLLESLVTMVGIEPTYRN